MNRVEDSDPDARAVEPAAHAPRAPVSVTLSDVDFDLAVESDLGIDFEVITVVPSRRGRAGTHQNCRALCRAPGLSTHG
jgi:hypothetical protein